MQSFRCLMPKSHVFSEGTGINLIIESINN